MRTVCLVVFMLFLFGRVSAQTCSGVPVAGVATAASLTPCGSFTDTLKLAGYSATAGIHLQWQYSADAVTWHAIAGATNATYHFIPSAADYYRSKVTCTASGDSSFSDTIQVTYSATCPCIPSDLYGYASAYSMWAFNLGGYGSSYISDIGTSPATYYEPRPDTIDLRQGGSYGGDIVTSISGFFPGYYYDNEIWIDFNDNGVFEPSESVTGVFVDSVTLDSFVLTIPLTAATGVHRMRVRNAFTLSPLFSTALDPCYYSDYSLGAPLYYQYGSTWDYFARIIYFPPCVGMPMAGVASSGSCTVCGADSIMLYNSGASTDSAGLTYQWQISHDSTTWANISGATSLSCKYYPTGTLVYRCKVGCHVSGDSIYSNPISVYYESSCPCTAEYLAFPDFSFLMSCFATDAYAGTRIHDTIITFFGLYGDADRSCAVPTLKFQQGSSYNDTVLTLGTSSSFDYQTAQVWIDFNDDGVFATGEAVSAIYGCLGCCNLHPIINIPYTATAGVHRMRVRYAQSSTSIGYPSLMDPCNYNYTFEDYSYGNAFDYLALIVHAPAPGITGIKHVCTGATTTLYCADTGGTWSCSPAGVAAIGSGSGIVTGLASGTAIITYVAGTLTDTTTVMVFPPPATGVISGSDSVCIGDSVALLETVTGGAWSSSNMSSASINASGMAVGITPGTDTIKYTVVSSDFGCVASAIFPFTVSLCTESVRELLSSPGNISIAPNPALNTLTVASDRPITSITITNLVGQTVYSLACFTNRVQADISHLPAGVYFARINGTEVRKFVKE